MSNERITENFVRETFRELGYYDDETITIEEQKSAHPIIQKCLRNASKGSGKGSGRPEFIIRTTKVNDFVIIFECKALKKFHQSPNLDKHKEYCVDGVLKYAAHLSKEFNVVAVAISGQEKKDLSISSFLWPRLSNGYKALKDKKSRDVKQIVPVQEYFEYSVYDPEIEKIRFDTLLAFSRDLHNYMRDYAKLSETEKPLLVSGILIGLMNHFFSDGYKSARPTDLAGSLINAISEEIDHADIPQASKKQDMLQPYSFIKVHPELSKVDQKIKETPLYHLVSEIDTHVKPFIDVYNDFDVIGQFYGEFLRYTGGDKKGLGIVLTPRHVTEIFSAIANLTRKSTVLDICAGTGGFLITSMCEMIKNADTEGQRRRIRQDGLIGIEQQPNMYALAASNMLLRGDGKANLYQGSCFDKKKAEAVRGRANVGMINPPYSQKGDDLHELNFVEHLLELLSKNGIGIAVVPFNCAVAPHTLKERILSKHRLDAVMSLPDDIFYPVGVVTCIMVFTAHVPHNQNPYHKTWFGYWKDDGFIKTKHKGRIDGGGWSAIRKKWLDAYFNKSVIAGFSIMQRVTHEDEWCAEAYLETDYTTLSEDDYLRSLKDYVLFKMMGA